MKENSGHQLDETGDFILKMMTENGDGTGMVESSRLKWRRISLDENMAGSSRLRMSETRTDDGLTS